ncbi:acyltransferase [Paenibacillus donghaensis]|uniref:acyltransferase n=1 Tax=Paenibacillus donghaensis TaxID=414771 RepID=UPI0018833095|nr:acyltransferase [Paenibacillus donghaensis]MBE9913115.1 acyltransferase [Paenibacillus donghaensis]
MPKKERIGEIELLRGLAFLAVALQHSIAHYAAVDGIGPADGLWMTILVLAAKFAVPVFIFITGLVLFYNYDGSLRYGSFIGKRFKDILVPYIFWSLIYFIVNQGLGHPFWPQFGKWAMMLVTGKNSYHLWYIVMIFQFYLLFPLLRYIMRECARRISFRWHAWTLAGFGLVCLMLLYNLFRISGWMAEADIPVLTPFFTTYADRNFLYFAFYFILGAAAGMNPEAWKRLLLKGKYVYWPAFLLLFGYYAYITVQSFGTPPEYHVSFNMLALLRPLITLFLVSSIFVFYASAKKWTEKSGPGSLKVMNALGRYSYGAYLAHALMLRNSYNLDHWLFAGWNVTVRMMISFLVCVVLSYAVAMALSYLPFGKWMVGVSSLRANKRGRFPAQSSVPSRSVEGG